MVIIKSGWNDRDVRNDGSEWIFKVTLDINAKRELTGTNLD